MFYKDNNDIYETNKGKLFFNRSINITAADKRWIQWISEPDTDCRVIQFLPKLKVWSDDIHSQSILHINFYNYIDKSLLLASLQRAKPGKDNPV